MTAKQASQSNMNNALFNLSYEASDILNERGEFHISHDASRLISVFSPRWKERSRVSREILNDLNFKMQLIQGKFQ